MVERVYNREWYLEEREELGKYKENSSKIWEEIEHKSKTIREGRNSKRRRF